jgi:hypothetical protein
MRLDSSLMPRWLRRLVLFVRRGGAERSMDAELRHHLECEIAERIRQGMPADDARRRALHDFGGVEAALLVLSSPFPAFAR